MGNKITTANLGGSSRLSGPIHPCLQQAALTIYPGLDSELQTI